jgi:hypothetical protein
MAFGLGRRRALTADTDRGALELAPGSRGWLARFASQRVVTPALQLPLWDRHCSPVDANM